MQKRRSQLSPKTDFYPKTTVFNRKRFRFFAQYAPYSTERPGRPRGPQRVRAACSHEPVAPSQQLIIIKIGDFGYMSEFPEVIWEYCIYVLFWWTFFDSQHNIPPEARCKQPWPIKIRLNWPSLLVVRGIQGWSNGINALWDQCRDGEAPWPVLHTN